MRGLADKTVKGWRERGTWRTALTLRFDLVQLGSTGTPKEILPSPQNQAKTIPPTLQRDDISPRSA